MQKTWVSKMSDLKSSSERTSTALSDITSPSNLHEFASALRYSTGAVFPTLFSF